MILSIVNYNNGDVIYQTEDFFGLPDLDDDICIEETLYRVRERCFGFDITGMRSCTIKVESKRDYRLL